MIESIRVTLEIADDGIGFDLARARPGWWNGITGNGGTGDSDRSSFGDREYRRQRYNDKSRVGMRRMTRNDREEGHLSFFDCHWSN